MKILDKWNLIDDTISYRKRKVFKKEPLFRISCQIEYVNEPFLDLYIATNRAVREKYKTL